MDGENIMKVQNQIRQNSDDLQKCLLDLELWEKDMKKKEEEFKKQTSIQELEIPPIRNFPYRSKKKRNHKKQKDKNTIKTEISENGDNQSSENVDQPITKEVPEQENTETNESGENSDNEEEVETLRKKQLACLHKEKGNEFFKKGNFDSAINSYTTGIMLDPKNPLLLANRAMAFLKKEQYQVAENDCTDSLSFDPTYTKAYLRRATARKNLNKISLAKEDFEKVLELEPDNKLAQMELIKLQKSLVKDSISISENNEDKFQELKAELSEIKTIKYNGEKPQVGKASEPKNRREIKTTQIDESTFVEKVEDTLQTLKSNTSGVESEISDLCINLEIPLPPVPSTSFQFVADWNEIAQNPSLRYQYLKQFPPEKLPVVFKHYMEPLIFPTLLETLSTTFIENGDEIFDYVKYLAEIGRFSTTLMFLSDKEEKDLQKLLEHVKSSKRPESEILEVLAKYKV